MAEKKLTNMEIFFIMIAIACGFLSIGYSNLILGGVCVIALFFTAASMINRYSKKN
jgi:energy-converting hydrogenase Eha subunit C